MQIQRNHVAKQRAKSVAQHEHPGAPVGIRLDSHFRGDEIVEESAQIKFDRWLFEFARLMLDNIGHLLWPAPRN